MSISRLILLLTPMLVAADWPQYRGPGGDGHAGTGASPPSKWSEAENVAWKVAVPGKGWSSPVVGGGKVWLTTAPEDGATRSLLGYDAATGKVAHDVKLFDTPNAADIRQYNSHATPTCALDSGKVYAHFGADGTACVEAGTGKVLWSRADLPGNFHRGAASSPVVWRGKLYLHLDSYDWQYVVCLDAATGATLWKHDRKLPLPENTDLRKAFATPAILKMSENPERYDLVSSAATGTVGLDPDTGAERWRVIHGGMNEASRPILGHGLVYLTAGHTQQIWAIKAGGSGDLTATGVAWKFIKEAPTRPSPILIGDHLYAVNDRGVLACLDARTGALKWQERLGETTSASPVFAAGRLYIAGEKGRTFVIDPSPEACRILETNTLAGGCLASPAVDGKRLYLRTRSHLYCLAAP